MLFIQSIVLSINCCDSLHGATQDWVPCLRQELGIEPETELEPEAAQTRVSLAKRPMKTRAQWTNLPFPIHLLTPTLKNEAHQMREKINKG